MPKTDRAARNGAYTFTRGLRTYYEVTGDGEPLVLLHGGLCTAETCDPQAEALAASYRVYVPERRGHGRTPDVEGPITYLAMAEDTLAFLDALGISSARLVGWSDGALVALLVALRAPHRVRRLVFMGQPVSVDGMRPESLAYLDNLVPRALPPELRRAYGAVSPDGPDHLAVVLEKLKRLWREPTGVTVSELTGVTAPTLVLVGDRDSVDAEHAVAVFRALPNGRLGIIPGATHAMPLERPDLVNQFILDFMAGGPEAD
jgi:pimeloyl-ACP methyl ester carboxylesterase